MFAVARGAAMAIAASGVVALVVVLAPIVGLRGHPRVSLWVSLLAAAVGTAVVIVQVTAASLWPAIAAADFMALPNLVFGTYSFPWTPGWAFNFGLLTPLIPAGGILALAAGYPARRAASRIAVLTMGWGACLLLVYVAAAISASWALRAGIPG